MSTPLHEEQDRLESQAMVAVELHTNYEHMRTFAHSLESLANGGCADAVLQADG